MASSSVPTAAATAAAAASIVAKAPQRPGPDANKSFSFRPVLKPKLPILSSKVSGLNCGTKRSSAIPTRAQLNEVVGGPSNDSAAAEQKPEVPAASGGEGIELSAKEAVAPMSGMTISEFMTQASNLVNFVDSRNISQLQLEQLDCKLVICKKEALPQPPPFVMMNPLTSPAVMSPQYAPPPPPPLAYSAQASAAASSAPLASTPATKSAKSSIPPLKSPMSGTFYKSPGPGQPPFVKVGDKVNKGQVLCIIEAMKLMNEIEADQPGTVVEILVDDAKPVSLDQPLFVIEP